MRYWKEGILFGACAVACAAPLLFGSAAIGLGTVGLGFLGWGEIGMATALVAVAAGFFVRRRFKPVALNPAGVGCGCAPTSGCHASNACEVPTSTEMPAAALQR